jgi:hypothetical protein
MNLPESRPNPEVLRYLAEYSQTPDQLAIYWKLNSQPSVFQVPAHCQN